MNVKTSIVGAALSLASFAPATAATSADPMGLAIGNLLVATYDTGEVVTGAFDRDGTVALTFPDGTKRRQAWLANADYFCMTVIPAADGKMNYRCERNLVAGKKLGQSWRQLDSEGKMATLVIKPRPR